VSTATRTSAYPITVDELADRVRVRTVELGAPPTQNQVMTEFKVGRPKAAAALGALTPDPLAIAEQARPGSGPDPVLPLTDPAGPGVGSVPVSTVVDAPPTPGPDPGAADTAAPAPDRSTSEGTAGRGSGPGGARRAGRVRSWPLLLLAAGAFVSIWGGWVGLGELTGFGPIRLLPGILDEFVINSAIALPIGVEAYAAFALRVWLTPNPLPARARRFAMFSAIGSLLLGAAGQVAYHLMTAAGITTAPWQITAFVACLPVVVLGCGAALAHLIHTPTDHAADQTPAGHTQDRPAGEGR